jgi:L-threonylcarbamoyladenylate synthase
MFIKLVDSDFDAIFNVINDATATVYKSCPRPTYWKKPCISFEELKKDNVQFYGLKENNTLFAVIGIQTIKEITLIRHMYVSTNRQRKGYGKQLLKYILATVKTETVFVCTWKDAFWAVNFYIKHGFKEESSLEEKKLLIHTYWNNLSKQQIEPLTVLKIQKRSLKTIIFQLDPTNPDLKKIQTAAKIIQAGGLVAFPTETVYGLGADALNNNAVLALFKTKKRPLDNPPILHIANINQVYQLAKEVSKTAEVLMKQFWPGPLTLILKRSEAIPKETTVGLDTVAIRMPNNNIALALIKQSKTSIAAPSANLSGNPSPTTAQHVHDDLNGKIDVILDGGQTSIGVESTVLDLSVDPPMLLRPGGTPFEAIRAVLPNVVLHPFVISEQEITVKHAPSPGMMHKHYAPNADVILVEGPIHAMIAKITALSEQYSREGKKVGILTTDENKNEYSAHIIKSLGSRSNLDIIASKLFKELREFNKTSVDVILAEGVPLEGMGLAVMNRLRKASGYHIIKT